MYDPNLPKVIQAKAECAEWKDSASRGAAHIAKNCAAAANQFRLNWTISPGGIVCSGLAS
jgi:hypothetical protein